MSAFTRMGEADSVMYKALSTPRDSVVGSKPDLSIYQLFNKYNVYEDLEIFIDTAAVRAHYGGRVKISYTTMGHKLSTKTPLFLILHGVPTNKKQWYPIAKYLSMFGFVVCLDMLGMGMSDKPRLANYEEGWMWVHDLKYLRPFARRVFGDASVGFAPRKFIFISDDWGSGIHAHYTAAFPEDIERNIFLDPIAGDGYPVKEIEAIGRAAGLPDVPTAPTAEDLDRFVYTLNGDEEDSIRTLTSKMIEMYKMVSKPPQLYFQHAMGAFDQTVLQIIKTMTYNPNVTNQYNQRDYLEPYADVDYERPGAKPRTMPLNFDAIRVLAERAAALSPDQLLPFHAIDNPSGVAYSEITADTLVLWGEFDNMMPTQQIVRFQAEFTNDKVLCDTQKIPRAGHFAGLDQPELVAEAIMSFLNRSPAMRRRFNDVYLGFTGIWKGDEKHVAKALRRFYEIPDYNSIIRPSHDEEEDDKFRPGWPFSVKERVVSVKLPSVKLTTDVTKQSKTRDGSKNRAATFH